MNLYKVKGEKRKPPVFQPYRYLHDMAMGISPSPRRSKSAKDFILFGVNASGKSKVELMPRHLQRVVIYSWNDVSSVTSFQPLKSCQSS